MAKCQALTRKRKKCKETALKGSRYCHMASHQAQGTSKNQEERKRFQSSRNILRWFLFTFLGINVLSIYPLYLYFNDRAIETKTGELKPNAIAPINEFSVGGVRYPVQSLDGVALRDGNGYLLKLESEQGRLLVSAKIRNSNGELVADILRNHWKINDNLVFSRNYTDDAVEIIDNFDNVVLQAVHVGEVVNIEGIFRCRSGSGGEIYHLPDGDAFMHFISPTTPVHNGIRRICKYPSEKYLGECPGLSKLKENLSTNNPARYPIDEQSSDFLCRTESEK